jgi:hypothetical protein
MLTIGHDYWTLNSEHKPGGPLDPVQEIHKHALPAGGPIPIQLLQMLHIICRFANATQASSSSFLVNLIGRSWRT